MNFRKRDRCSLSRFCIVAPLVSLVPLGAIAQILQPPFDVVYSVTDLGSVPSLPPNYGGLNFKLGDPNIIIIGGSANTPTGKLYEIGVLRDANDHIVGFSGIAAVFAEAAFNDGGVSFGPNDVLFTSRWPVNEIGQLKPGSFFTDKIVSLAPLGIASSPGAVQFVPPGFPGTGSMKIISWPGGQWYDVSFASDGSGTFDLLSASLRTSLVGGPEGLIYVPLGSAEFLTPSVLVAEFSAGNVAAYEIDGNGDAIPSTRRIFIAGLFGAEGAVLDPLTNDFLFATFGGGNRVVVVQGFEPPVLDEDQDGILDDLDLCPDTASGDPVDAVGCSDAQVDADSDGVCDLDAASGGPSECTGVDQCADTLISEGVPTVRLVTNRWALMDDDLDFDTTAPNGNGPGRSYSTTDTAGCSCEQIIEAQGLGNGHTKFGCSISAMDDWVELVN